MSASLFIGRWQPFHDGHREIVEKVLAEGRDVVVAIRDTPLGPSNPYTTAERWNMIASALAAWGSQVKIVVVPDVDEVCHGREPGWSVREIGGTKPEISGSALRMKRGSWPVFWIFGQSGQGKTTLAKALSSRIGAINLDGDEMRQSISTKEGFGWDDRHQHNCRVARLAEQLAKQRPVVVSLITPFEETRQTVVRICGAKLMWLERVPTINSPQRPFERPIGNCFKSDGSVESALEFVRSFL